MGKDDALDFQATASPLPDQPRKLEEVLRDCKLAIAQNSNYGRQSRTQGANPYDNRLGRPQRDVWGNHKRPT